MILRIKSLLFSAKACSRYHYSDSTLFYIISFLLCAEYIVLAHNHIYLNLLKLSCESLFCLLVLLWFLLLFA